MDYITLHRSGVASIGLVLAGLGAMYVSYVKYREKQNRAVRRPVWVGLLLVVGALFEAFMLGVLASHYGQP
jgi:hypothetical protein